MLLLWYKILILKDKNSIEWRKFQLSVKVLKLWEKADLKEKLIVRKKSLKDKYKYELKSSVLKDKN